MATTKAEYPSITIKSGNVVFISDIHFGWNASSEEWQENQRDYFENWFIPKVKALLEKTPDLVLCCLGDVYDDRKSIDIDVNEMSIDIFEELAEILPCYIINGNHDLSKKTNKGNSSLRSLSNIKNLKVIKEPTLLKFVREKKTLCSVAAIPYLGDCNDENKELVRFSGKASIALMHTDISKMKFDNGMTIVGAVDAEKFAGRVIAGHIHKRQETEKVVYVGNPYHLKRSDIDNQKGIYTMNMETGILDFIPNNYSPIFQKIDIEMFMNMSDQDKMRALHNNYTDVLVNEEDEHKYKMADIRALLSQSNAKRAEIKSVHQKNESTEEDDEVHEEHTVDELIEQSIDSLEGYEDEYKAELKVLSHEYITAAQSILASESNV